MTATVAKPLSVSFRQSVARLKTEHAKWDDKAPPAIEWWAAAKSVIVEFAAHPLTDDQLHLADPIAKMARGYFEPRRNKQKEEIEGMPSRELCDGINQLFAAQPRQWPKIETIAVLHKQSVNIQQIARMHGLAIDVVQDVIDKGESAYPPGHVTPHTQVQVAAKRKIRDQFKLAIGGWEVTNRSREETKGGPVDDVDGETTPEMLARGAFYEEIRASRSIRQSLMDGVDCATAARIYEVDPESVIAEAKQLGLVPDTSTRADGLKDATAADDALVEDVLSMHQQGETNKQVIADAVNSSVQRVAAIIAGYERRMKNQGALAGQAANE